MFGTRRDRRGLKAKGRLRHIERELHTGVRSTSDRGLCIPLPFLFSFPVSFVVFFFNVYLVFLLYHMLKSFNNIFLTANTVKFCCLFPLLTAEETSPLSALKMACLLSSIEISKTLAAHSRYCMLLLQ
ncbi:Hypothetical predicted protein [Podarcis lilfordi]|uniref:Uncharacterized protein n=1 Tax=Podarcis lilfordi TaxID=74358 RepID=A0AA35L244_9SAUR|nr:Hypothetical predicted protein [Podarcis lilfordi]